MLRNGLFFIILIGVFYTGYAQNSHITRINNLVTLIDKKIPEEEFLGTRFEDDYGNETTVKAYLEKDDLLKLEAISSNLGGSIRKTYYFYGAELIMVDILELDHPGLPNWEEAKSDDLGNEELKRVQNIVKKESRYYLKDGEVLKSLPVTAFAPHGEKLRLEVNALLRKLE